MLSAIYKYLSSIGIVDYDNCIVEKDEFTILFRDKLRTAIEKSIAVQKAGQYQNTDELLQAILREAKNNGAIVLDSWNAIIVQDADCSGCPALHWILPGQKKCRLGFEINKNRPVSSCLCPLNVGASYAIARELDIDDPMVGKLDKWQYDRYQAEKKEIESI